MDGLDVTAGAQAAFTTTGDEHSLDRVIVLPLGQGLVDDVDHFLVERVDSTRLVQFNASQPAFGAENDRGFFSQLMQLLCSCAK